VQPDSIYQQAKGRCSPNIGQTGGNVTLTIYCPEVDPKALEALNNNKDMKFTKEEIRLIKELLQQAKATTDAQVRQQAEALGRICKLSHTRDLIEHYA
jgi:hypothetical protein